MLHLRDHPTGCRDRVTAIYQLNGGVWTTSPAVTVGDIAKVRGLTTIRVGDPIGTARRSEAPQRHHFAQPTLQAVVAPVHPADRARLRSVLAQLADQDPLINVRTDASEQTAVSLYGEVQKEVIAATLADEFGIDVVFRDTTALCVERPAGVGTALERLNTPSNPHHATIGLRIEPAAPGSGIELRVRVDHRRIPLYVYKTSELFVAAMNEYVRDALRAGPTGWPVTDCVITMTDCGYSVADGPPSLRGPTTTAADFRKLTPIVVAEALLDAGTIVCEPLARVTLDIPAWSHGTMLSLLSTLHAAIEEQAPRGDEVVIVAVLSAADAQRLHAAMPANTAGEGVLESSFAGHRQRTE
jgi:ribosomal protection tetracycline resistance protein